MAKGEYLIGLITNLSKGFPLATERIGSLQRSGTLTPTELEQRVLQIVEKAYGTPFTLEQLPDSVWETDVGYEALEELAHMSKDLSTKT